MHKCKFTFGTIEPMLLGSCKEKKHWLLVLWLIFLLQLSSEGIFIKMSCTKFDLWLYWSALVVVMFEPSFSKLNILPTPCVLCLIDLHYRTFAFIQSQLTAFETWVCRPVPHQCLLIKTDSGICGSVQDCSILEFSDFIP